MLSFANAVGTLYNRLGKVGALIKNMASYQNTQLIAMTNTTTGVVAQFNAESDIQAIMGSNYIPILSAIDGTIGGVAQNIASQTIQRMVFRDNPKLNQNLTQGSNLVCLYEIIRQMKLEGATILRMTVTGVPVVGPNPPSPYIGTGNGILVVSMIRPFDGQPLENAFAENLTVTCTQDSYVGGATVGNEQLTITGTGNQTDQFAFNWPLGSNGTASVNSIDGNSSNQSGNLLTNSGFEAWTGNIPDSWTLVTGTAGVNIFQENTLNYDGVASMRILGDGSTLTTIKQQLATSSALSPLSQYSFNIFARRDAIAPTGIWTISLVDQNGNVVKDANNVNNTFTINMASLSTVYNSFTGIVRTPWIMPSQLFWKMGLTTALPNGRSVYFDKASLGQMTQVYTQGPFVANHSGSIPYVQGDYATITITNSRGAGGTLSTWQTLWYQLFSEVQANEILFPSSATPNVSDLLIG